MCCRQSADLYQKSWCFSGAVSLNALEAILMASLNFIAEFAADAQQRKLERRNRRNVTARGLFAIRPRRHP